MADRHFTRAEIEAHVLKWHQPYNESNRFEVTRVALVKGIPATLWRVEFDSITTFVTGRELRTELVDLVTEAQTDGKWYLWPLVARTIPDGCKTTEEEDAAIEAAEQAERKEFQQE
jgi:hypothetical protein